MELMNWDQVIPHLSWNELFYFFPAMLLLFSGSLTLILGLIWDKHQAGKAAFGNFLISFITLMICFFLVHALPDVVSLPIGHVINPAPGFRGVLELIFLGSAIALVFLYLQDIAIKFLSEFYSLFLFSLIGGYFIVLSHHLLFLFIALEILSFSLYIMVSLKRLTLAATEAGMKYFILGGVASCLILYGSVLLFGATGSFLLSDISQSLYQVNSDRLLFMQVGAIALFSGLLFKIGAFPFHSWVPDVYQGAPSALTGWMSTIVKLVAFLFFIKVANALFFVGPMYAFFSKVLPVIAVLSMFYGNILAIQQHSLKRMLAYSSIAHAGYVLMGITAMCSNPFAYQAVVIYLFFYTLASVAGFGILAQWEHILGREVYLDDLSFMGKTFLKSSLAFSVTLLALAGIPLTAGFVGKFILISEAIAGREILTVFMLVVASVIGSFYYLRSISYLFFYRSAKDGGYENIQSLTTPNSSSNFSSSSNAHLRVGSENWLKFWPAYILCILILFIGVAPEVVTQWLLKIL